MKRRLSTKSNHHDDYNFKLFDPQTLRSKALGSKTLGSQTSGSQTSGSQALGSQALGSQALGSQALTKACSNCDPDIPGHAKRDSCGTCFGTGQELLSFAATSADIAQSKRKKPRKKYDEDRDGEDADAS